LFGIEAVEQGGRHGMGVCAGCTILTRRLVPGVATPNNLFPPQGASFEIGTEYHSLRLRLPRPAPSPLAREGWGEGVTSRRSNITLSPALPQQAGGRRSVVRLRACAEQPYQRTTRNQPYAKLATLLGQAFESTRNSLQPRGRCVGYNRPIVLAKRPRALLHERIL
jgi:hypothetical protein